MKKRAIILSAAVVVVAAVILLIVRRNGPEQAVSYATVTIAPASISNSVTATGTVEPITQVEIGTQVSGMISKIYVDYNSVVKAGQLLAEMDMTTLLAEYQASEASLASSRTEYEYQTKNYERQKNLFEKGLISSSDFETAEYEYYKSKSAYEQSQANSVKAKTNIGYARITSPIDGVVLSRDVDEGQTVAAGYSTPTLFTVANDLTKMQVIADVDEADIGEVEEGQTVSFTVDAFPDDTFTGTVRQVRLQSTTTSNVVTYEVVIDAPNPDLKLMPGLTANVSIATLDKSGIFIVPLKALRFEPEGYRAADGLLEKHVWVERNGSLEPVEVVTGVSDGIYTEIVSGLSAGDQTVHALRGISFTIHEGEFVTIMGTSGSGKSTLLNILGCLDTPTSGEYILDGVPVRKMSSDERATLRNRKIGFVFQSYNLLPKTTAVENVELPLLYNRSVGRLERRRRAVTALEAVGLQSRLNHRSNQMSGGQQQRVAIARALVNDPVILLADEATGNLDTRTSFEILTLFQQLHDQGRTIIFVTHNPDIARFSSRNITLRDGRIIEDTINDAPASAAEVLATLPQEELS